MSDASGGGSELIQQRQIELDRRIENFSSLDYTEFHASSRRHVKEKSALFKALCHFEDELIEELEHSQTEEEDKEKRTRVYIHLGHVHLLALDWIKALSAYQKAYKLAGSEFSRDESCLYGLGLAYFHFRLYKPAIYLLNQLIYNYPFSPRSSEVHARLGIANKYLGDYQQAFRHLRIAANDAADVKLCPRYVLKFHIAHCFDLFGELIRAKQEYKRILDEYGKQSDEKTLPADIHSAVLRQSGWVSYRQSLCCTIEEKQKLINEAEMFLSNAIEVAKAAGLRHLAGQAQSFLGRILSEQPSKEERAFDNLRAYIDCGGGDANTWFCIGELYSKKGQPKDALQAFACSVALDPTHISSWVSVGQLYELHKLFKFALDCYKEAVKQSNRPTEWLNQRIRILERELLVAEQLASTENKKEPKDPQQASGQATGKRKDQTQPAPQPQQDLIGPDKWHTLTLVTQIKGQIEHTLRKQEHHYSQGSLLWQMTDVTAQLYQMEPFNNFNLDPTIRQIRDILKVNELNLTTKERELLRQLEERLPLFCGPRDSSEPEGLEQKPIKTEGRPKETGFPVLSHDEVDDLLGENADVPRAQTSAMNGVSSPQPNQFTATEPADENTKPSEDIFATPPALNLMAELKVPITTSAREILDVCRRRRNRQPNTHVFDERCGPPKPPTTPKNAKINLHPQVPLIYVENDRDAKSIELQNFCYKSTIALVRGLTGALKVDLSQFSTKTLIQTDRNHEVEVRTQLKMPGDANLDNLGRHTWSCYSAKSFSSVVRYGQYQAESFRHSLKEETEKLRNVKQTPPTQRAPNGEPAPKRRKAAVAAIQAEAEAQTNLIPTKTIKFGTNVDLSDELKFNKQLKELSKMPAFCRLHSASNLLSYLDFKVLGMNTVQLYMKVPGCRTPGHLENNSFASVNVNIGPGECEWFGVAWEYYPMIDKMCRERGLDFLRGAWWPSYDELINAGIPVYRFTQKAGDLVWVGGGCVHWVQATGWCNNIAWNVGPSTATQVEMAVRAYEWNRLNSYRSLVPMQHLCWQIARALRFTDQKLFNLVKGVLVRSLAYARMVADFAEEYGNLNIKFQSRIKNEGAHYCNLCEIEVFNILFVKEFNSKFRVFCVSCAKRGNIKEYIVLQQYTFEELSNVFDQFQFVPVAVALANSNNKTALIC